MIDNIVTISLLCVTVHALTRETGMLSFWQKIIVDKELNLRTVLFEPLTECLCCMASFWTVVFLGLDGRISTIQLGIFLGAVFAWLVSWWQGWMFSGKALLVAQRNTMPADFRDRSAWGVESRGEEILLLAA